MHRHSRRNVERCHQKKNVAVPSETRFAQFIGHSYTKPTPAVLVGDRSNRVTSAIQCHIVNSMMFYLLNCRATLGSMKVNGSDDYTTDGQTLRSHRIVLDRIRPR
ncbi:hypothetical protein Y032_0296g1698 [Ancylostoma ceylanicum]|uniref:Uncharacterized protein n=1 Tax=Ancylostoma ceylanicum TaxID=53326 RepID=A0A016S5S1_9BILA|nr:hypothetical protein Y032_0296g1698 [Ancylostoma ceylanicum]